VRLKKSSLWICKLWERSVDDGLSRLSFLEKICFYFLCFCKPIYRAVFFLVISVKKLRGVYDCSPYKIISVGNLSVGGTGKSVFVQFLVKTFKNHSCAILSRGYGRKSNKKNGVVTREIPASLDSISFGDEVVMLAQNLLVPVVVGKDRVRSVRLLKKFCHAFDIHIDYLILDDAYQNYQLKKDFEILLLDARKPFGNGHCLPAGPLREKDFSRAHSIVLTHADKVSQEKINGIMFGHLQKFPRDKIFMGKHEICGVRHGECEDYVDVRGRRFLVVAGIGAFSSFMGTVQKYGVVVGGYIRFVDHFRYGRKNVNDIIVKMRSSGCEGVITTQKDWVKLLPLVKDYCSLFYILEISFSFLSQEEGERFLKIF